MHSMLAELIRPSAPAGGTDDTLGMPMMRQGDILLKSVAAIPAGFLSIPRPVGGFALMEPKSGTGTGSHFIGSDDRQVTAFARHADAPISFITVTGSFGWLSHHEHAPIVVPPGIWAVIRQREHVVSENDTVQAVRAIAD